MKKEKIIYRSVWLLLFLVLAIYCQCCLAYNYFYVEQFNLFCFDSDYAVNCLTNVGGVASYLGAFFTQFFIYPYTGAVITAFLVTVVAWEMYLCWRKLTPAVCFPILFLLPGVCLIWAGADFNYHFVEGAFSLVAALALLNIYLRIRAVYKRYIFILPVSWIGYYAIGPHIFVTVSGAILAELFSTGRYRWGVLSFIPWAAALPFGLYAYGIGAELRLLFTPDAYYHPYLPTQTVNYYAGLTVIGNILVACSLQKIGKAWTGWKRNLSVVLQSLLVFAGMHYGVSRYNSPQNYDVKELDYYCRTGEWQKILDFPRLYAGRNFMHACYQNLALSHLGKLGDSLLSYPQCGIQGLVLNWNQSVNSSILLSDIYYQMGNVALAQEMAFEGMIGSEKAVNPRLLLRLIQTNLIFGHDAIAEKYIRLLEKTCGYAEKAASYRRFLYRPEAVLQDTELGEKLRCARNTSGLSNSHAVIENLRQIILSNPAYKPACQYYGAICLLDKNMNRFKAFIEQCKNEKGLRPMPVLFQEALILMHEHESEVWAEYGITPEVQKRFKAYRQIVFENRRNPELPRKLQMTYGNTFWFYYMFNK